MTPTTVRAKVPSIFRLSVESCQGISTKAITITYHAYMHACTHDMHTCKHNKNIMSFDIIILCNT